MTDLEIFPRHELIRQDRCQKRAAAGEHGIVEIVHRLDLDRVTVLEQHVGDFLGHQLGRPGHRADENFQ